MPRLLNDLLVLSKQRHILALEKPQYEQKPIRSSLSGISSALIGSLLTLLVVASVSYLHLFGY